MLCKLNCNLKSHISIPLGDTKYFSTSCKQNRNIQHWLWRVRKKEKSSDAAVKKIYMNLFVCHMMCVIKNLKNMSFISFLCICWARKNAHDVWWHQFDTIFDACWIFFTSPSVSVWKSDRKSVEKPQTGLFIPSTWIWHRKKRLEIKILLFKCFFFTFFNQNQI